MKQHKRGPSNKNEVEYTARMVAQLETLARRYDDQGDSDRANSAIIAAELEKGRLVGRRVA